MRRLLLLLCAAALGSTVLGAPPVAALQPTWLVVSPGSPLLNENGDGYWESASVTVHTDADTAHWALKRGGQLVAEADLTRAQLSDARHGTALPIDSATAGRTLAAGTYTLTVTATTDGEEPSRGSETIYVSTAPPLTAMTPGATVIYPRDVYPGVGHGATFRHRLDPTILKWGVSSFEVVAADGTVVESRGIRADDPLLRWQAGAWSDDLGEFEPVTAGTYRVRLVIEGQEGLRGPLSRPFTVSHGYRVLTKSSATKVASATRTGTLTERHARLRILDGRLHYRATNRHWRNTPVVRTAHRVTVPRNLIPGSARLVVRGRWQHDGDIDLEVVRPDGQVRNIDVYLGVDTRTMTYPIPTSLVRTDGSVRFRLVWTSHGVTGAPGRIGRTDSVGVHFTRYVWRGLD